MLFGIAESKETHRLRRRIARILRQFRIELCISESGKSTASMIEEHDLGRSNYSIGCDEFSEHIIGYRRPCGSDDVQFGVRQTKYCGKVRQAGIHAGYHREPWS